ncbi:MAG TPA: tetratricopeptide repeat protein [Pirellulaceae bacterium]|nr:tetratricopeptide repeat protein [Pirellulaceae bacterium]
MGSALAELGRLDEALTAFRRAADLQPRFAAALRNLGTAAQLTGRDKEAIAAWRKLLEVDDRDPRDHLLLGRALLASGHAAAAFDALTQAATRGAAGADLQRDRALALHLLGRNDEALVAAELAVLATPDDPSCLLVLAGVLRELGRWDEAWKVASRSLELRPDSADCANLLGAIARARGRPGEAIEWYERAMRLDPGSIAVLVNCGHALVELGRLAEAEQAYGEALRRQPDHVDAIVKLAAVLRRTGRREQAISIVAAALDLQPDQRDLLYALAALQQEIHALTASIATYKRLLEKQPDAVGVAAALVHQQLHSADWADIAPLEQRIIDFVERDGQHPQFAPVAPFTFLSLSRGTTSRQQLLCARQWLARSEAIARAARDGWQPETRPRRSMHDARPVIGYLSDEFHDHPVAWLIVEMLERHDRSRFKTIGYSYGPDDSGATRRRITDALERFVDIRSLGTREAAELIAADGVDILVDLKGFTKDARTEILAMRPAPIQANFLGYPGTMGADFVDYILVDEFVAPAEREGDYAERLVYLPVCYQPNDSRRAIAERTPTRGECGLPEAGFVFCCFNNGYKLTPAMFDAWMRLLRATPGSVLWLLATNETATGNLRREAQRRGVAGERLVFAPRMPLDRHLARHRLADLFLDTLPYNAHTTASDALWAGLPVLTLVGDTFAGRVAGSLLHALGLDDLICRSLAEYEGKALDLARRPQLLARFRSLLAERRLTSGLFDGARAARDVERAFDAMLERHRAGEPPRPINVAAPARSDSIPAAPRTLPPAVVRTANPLAAAVEHHRAGRLAEAAMAYEEILAREPGHADATHLFGVVAHQRGDHLRAIELIESAIRLNPRPVVFHTNLAAAQMAAGRPRDAADSFQRALDLNPNAAEVWRSLANAWQAAGDMERAEECFRRALALHPDAAETLNGLGCLARLRGRLEEAERLCRRAVELAPDYARAWGGLGNALAEQNRLDEALECLDRCVHLDSRYAEGHNNRGNVCLRSGRHADALRCYRRALELKPDYFEAWNNLGNALHAIGESHAALDAYAAALRIDPDYSDARYHRALVLHALGRTDEAIREHRIVAEKRPTQLDNLAALAHQMQHVCDWDGLERLSERIVGLAGGEDAPKGAAAAHSVGAMLPVQGSVPPFAFITLPTVTTPLQQRRCAERWVASRRLAVRRRADEHRRTTPLDPEKRLTIGYLSNDLRAHAMACLVAEWFEEHERERFKIIGYTYSREDASPLGRRISAAFDLEVDIDSLPTEETCRRIESDGVDILVDLKGHTKDARLEIFARRAAPIQVSYLGFPGTMGAEFIDYVLVDEFIAPPEHQPYYTERLVQLPGCYFVNDGRREVSSRGWTRAECGLPESGFVLCSFNNSFKITPPVFDVWMRLLQRRSDAVLWLLIGNQHAPANLRREAARRGVAPERLVFAPRVPVAEHLARQRLADLFLDTLPCNAHTTASDALWVGLPVLTVAGPSFVSRVAGSLLRAVGLPELITENLADYERLAGELMDSPERLRGLRDRLLANRPTADVFQGRAFARKAEAAYRRMWQLHAAGQRPRGFRVETWET